MFFHKFTQLCVADAMGTTPGVIIVWSLYRITPIYWLMARDTIIHDWNRLLLAPSYSSDFPYLGRKRLLCAVFLAHFSVMFCFSDCISGVLFPEWWVEWTFVSASLRALVSSWVTTSTVSASDVWAWPMQETLSLAFLTASAARI